MNDLFKIIVVGWLMYEFGKNKQLPQGYEMQALQALSYYPELKDIEIHFLIQPAWIPLSSRPHPWRLLLSWKKRIYLVVISSKTVDFMEPILLKNLPYNAQVGVLGHELAHTVHYLDKSGPSLAWTAGSYLNSSFRRKFERDTDKRAIAHGLAYQLYDFAVFVRQQFEKLEEVPSGMEEAEDSYLSPEEILEEMKQYDFYGE